VPTQPAIPAQVRSPRGSAVTEIDWSDGQTTRYHHRTLRALCPCAKCQGHDGGIRWVKEAEQSSRLALEVSDLEQVGNYALGFSWGDGHGGGIYTFEYLRELGRLFDASDDLLRAYHRP
jgi:DUF971 family protein